MNFMKSVFFKYCRRGDTDTKYCGCWIWTIVIEFIFEYSLYSVTLVLQYVTISVKLFVLQYVTINVQLFVVQFVTVSVKLPN
jgi:hypothetical protein